MAIQEERAVLESEPGPEQSRILWVVAIPLGQEIGFLEVLARALPPFGRVQSQPLGKGGDLGSREETRFSWQKYLADPIADHHTPFQKSGVAEWVIGPEDFRSAVWVEAFPECFQGGLGPRSRSSGSHLKNPM